MDSKVYFIIWVAYVFLNYTVENCFSSIDYLSCDLSFQTERPRPTDEIDGVGTAVTHNHKLPARQTSYGAGSGEGGISLITGTSSKIPCTSTVSANTQPAAPSTQQICSQLLSDTRPTAS